MCTIGGACRILGRWLEKNLTSAFCKIYQPPRSDRCFVEIANEGAAKAITDALQLPYPRSEEFTKDVAEASMFMSIICDVNSLIFDIPIPREEFTYWKNRVDDIVKEFEGFSLGEMHEHMFRKKGELEVSTLPVSFHTRPMSSLPVEEAKKSTSVVHIHLYYYRVTRPGVRKIGQLILDNLKEERGKLKSSKSGSRKHIR